MSISTITTTGFYVSDFEFWNFDARAILFLLMFFGACASSTSGGIKITRWIFLGKYLKNELSKIIHPQAIYPIKIDNKTVAEDVRRQLLAFIFFYLLSKGQGDWPLRRTIVLPFLRGPSYTPPMKNSLKGWLIFSL